MTTRPLVGRTALATLLVLATVAPAAAQFTLRGGVNLTTFVGGDAEDVESRKGLNLGAAVPLFHFGPVAIVPEVYYAQKGAEHELGGGLPGVGQLKLDYIEIPVLARVGFGSGSIRPYLQAGPAFAWQLDCTLSAEALAGAQDADCADAYSQEGLEAEFRDYDQGLVFGGGVDFGLAGIGALNLDARFERGLARISRGDGADLKNQAFTLMLGWRLGGPGMLR